MKELIILENLSQKLNVDMAISGVSGTVNSAPKAKTITSVVTVSIGFGLKGNLRSVMDFVETLEHLNFVVNVSGISLSAGEGDTVSASLSAGLYLKK